MMRHHVPGRSLRTTRRQSRPSKPSLEALEDRCLLTAFLVTNTNDLGPGSLRAAILAANGSLVPDSIEFDIPVIDPGFITPAGVDCDSTNDGVPDSSPCWWRISLATGLDALTNSGDAIRGFTQTTNRGDTNPGQVGSGGTVGVDALPFAKFDRPEVAIDGNGTIALSIEGAASSVTIEGLAVYGAGSAAVSSRDTGTDRLVTRMLIGTLPDGTDPDPALGPDRNQGFGVQTTNTAETTVDRSFVGLNGQNGIDGAEPNSVLHATNNEVFGNGWRSVDHDGIDLNGVNGSAIGNLTYGNTNTDGAATNSGGGIEVGSTSVPGSGDNLVENNTSRDNRSAGISIRKGSSGNTISKNIVTGNNTGISVSEEGNAPTNGNVFSHNSIFLNTALGIDLNASSSNAFDGPTPNDQGDADAGSNDLANYPIIKSAKIVGSSLIVTGVAEPGSVVQFFLADNQPSGDASGFGEGETFLAERTEGSVDDTGGGTDSYGPLVAGHCVVVGCAGTITANRFVFSISPVPAGVVVGSLLSATATVAQPAGAPHAGTMSTSEFGPNANVAGTGTVEVVKDLNPAADPGRFNLQIDGSTEKANAADGDTTGAKALDPGTHTVRETAGTQADNSTTNLGLYTSSISCVESPTGGTNPASPVTASNVGPVDVPVAVGDAWLCTITNTRRTGTIEVVKDLIPAADPGRFNLQIDSVTEKANAADGDTTGAKTVNTGDHSVRETAGTQADSSTTNLGLYTSSISCVESPTGGTNPASPVTANNVGPVNVPVAFGDQWLCTITNTRRSVPPSRLLWGIDEDDGELFSIADYTKIPNVVTSGLIRYGRLMYVNNGITGSIAQIGRDIEAMEIDSNGDMYFAVDHQVKRFGGLPTLNAPVLFKFNISGATTVGPNVATVVGRIPIPGFGAGGRADNISGLGFQPGTGTLFALYRVNNQGRDPDHLLTISKTNAALISDLGQIRNDVLGVISDEGEELEFDDAGNLFVSDDQDEHLYQVNPANAQIIAVADNDERGGTGLSSLKIEALAWDVQTGRFVTNDDNSDKFGILTVGNGANSSLGKFSGLTDTEGLDFFPKSVTAASVAERVAAPRLQRTGAAVADLVLNRPDGPANQAVNDERVPTVTPGSAVNEGAISSDRQSDRVHASQVARDVRLAPISESNHTKRLRSDIWDEVFATGSSSSDFMWP